MRKMLLIAVLSVIAMTAHAQWHHEMSKDIITDESRIVLFSPAISGNNSYGYVPEMYLRMVGYNVDLYISWGEYVSGDYTEVVIRVDDYPPITLNCPTSTKGTSTFFVPSVATAKFFYKSKKVAVRVVPYNSSPITVLFDLTGLSETINLYPELSSIISAE